MVRPISKNRVLVVDDSPTVRAFLSWMIERAGFTVVGTASGVAEAERMVRVKFPDLVLSDVRMADGDGVELTRRVLAQRGVPIVLITAHDATNPDLVFRAIESGALDVLPKPPPATSAEFESYRRAFEATLRSFAGLPVIRRRQFARAPSVDRGDVIARQPISQCESATSGPIIAMAASTGGPVLIGDLLRALPRSAFAFAVVVQHIVAEFADSFRVWLGEYSGHRVLCAEEGKRPSTGCVYTAPPNCHLQLQPEGTFHIASNAVHHAAHVPSADVLFESLARATPRATVAILLTGMGSDGAAGLRALKVAGALTIVQRPDTAAVDGMPRSAIACGAATYELEPKVIMDMLGALPPLGNRVPLGPT